MYEKARIINSGGLESSFQNKWKPPKKKLPFMNLSKLL